jgi:hypothetical protein
MFVAERVFRLFDDFLNFLGVECKVTILAMALETPGIQTKDTNICLLVIN